MTSNLNQTVAFQLHSDASDDGRIVIRRSNRVWRTRRSISEEKGMNRNPVTPGRIPAWLLMANLILAGCGGGSSTPAVNPPSNSPPSISGIPGTSVTAGKQYLFQPSASDPDNDSLTFSISGVPDWAVFDTSTGQLSGIPANGDAGDYLDILISVSDGTATTSLPAFGITVLTSGPIPTEFGLDSRPDNMSCLAVEPPATASIRTERQYTSLVVNDMTAVAQAPGDSSGWYFATRDGLIGRFDNDPDVSNFSVVLDYRSRVTTPSDGGLIALAFHPDFPVDRRVFALYSVAPTGGGAFDGDAFADTVISSFILSPDGMTIDPLQEEIILQFSRGRYHHGGFLSFDRNGYLLIGIGDGTTQGDPTGRGQDVTDILGKILRIDVDASLPYEIPADNPFAGTSGMDREEIYAFGLRNPFRGDVDPETGRIYIGDVGRREREEVSEVLGGANLGWNIKEGFRCHREDFGDCDDPALVDPLIDYQQIDGNCAIIGGYFYRGQLIPELTGRFLFADFCSSKISAVEFDNNGEAFELSLLPGGNGLGSIHTFAKDNDGELYVVTSSQVHKIVANDGSSGPPGPAATLSQTGCFDPSDASVPAAGLIPYTLQSALWSDGAAKRRWIALPNGRTIDLDSDGDLLFPDGTVLVKEFAIDNERIETRLFMKDNNGVWAGYSYEWIGNDAFLLPAARQKVLTNGQTWHFPDRGECLRCHTSGANFALGPEIGQLNGDMEYVATNRLSNQLATMEHVGLFTNGLPDSPDQLPALAGVEDVHQSVSRRARSYLHSNCSGCHRGEGATQSNMDFRFWTSRTDMNVCNADPAFGNLGTAGAKILAPGQPDTSILVKRPGSTNPLERMPPLATFIIDDAAIAMLQTWISSPDVCAVETDSDLDAVSDDADNCPSTANPDQADRDQDGIGDLCDAN